MIGVVEPTALHRVKCQEPGCGYQMLAISDLRNHLSNHHQRHEYKCTEEKKFTSLAGRVRFLALIVVLLYKNICEKISWIGKVRLKQVQTRNM